MSKTESAGWGSRVGLVLAMAGNAVGLGNFLRFPVQAIQNGGGAFIIPYLVCFLLMGIPLLFVEWGIGRHGGKKGHHSTPFILDTLSKKAVWKYVGVFGIFTNLAVAAYYCYIESWTLSYVWHSLTDTFSGKTQGQVATFFNDYVSLDTLEPIIFWVICLLINTWILSRGLSGGVEKVAKIGMPLLLVFGAFLAVKAISIKAGSQGAIFDGVKGLDFLWTPKFDTIWSAKVWLAAAGQIFFTLSIGMGSIQCYASYLKSKDDIALNAMSAGWMNGFVEIVLGSAIIIPISVGYFGIEGVQNLLENGGGLGLGFKTLPYLFEQWGSVLGVVAGVAWFGLLFFAGITSSLAMGTPVIGFLHDEFNWKEKNAAWAFGGLVFLLGLPTVLFFNNGVFDEYDYWAGTVSLVVFALLETILFGWVFGIDKAWKEINKGADIKVPDVFKYLIKYVTPLLLLFVFVNSIPEIVSVVKHDKSKELIAYYQQPEKVQDDYDVQVSELKKLKDFDLKFLDDKLTQKQIDADKSLSSTTYLKILKTRKLQHVLNNQQFKEELIKTEKENMLFKDISRIFLLLMWLGIAYLVYIAYKRRQKGELAV